MLSCLEAVTGLNVEGGARWYCLRTQPKREHIAAAQLRLQPDVEVFLPWIRYRRPTRNGPAWVTEALFKDYCFARFEAASALRRVQHARGVSGVVHFGSYRPAIADSVIDELRAAMAGQDLCELDEVLQSGDLVEINAGPLCGLQAVVTRVLSAKQRVAVLLDFLGRKTETELDCNQVKLESDQQHPWLRHALGNAVLGGLTR